MANLSISADSIVLNQIRNLTTTLEKINSLEILRTSTSTTTTTTTSPKITINSFFPEFYDLGYPNPNESKDNNTNNLLLKSSEIFGLVPTDYDGSILFDNKSLLFQDDQDYSSSSSSFYNDTFSSDQLVSQLKTPLFYILFMLLIYGAIILVVFMSAIYSHRKRAGYSYEDDECSSRIEHRRLDEEEEDVVNEVKRSRSSTKPRVYLKDEARREPESLLLNENVKKYDIGCEDVDEEELGPMSDDIVVDLVEDYSSDSSEEVGSDDEFRCRAEQQRKQQQQPKHTNRDRTEWSFGATIKNMIASTRLLKAKGFNQMVGEREGIIGDNKLFKKKRFLGDSAENEVLMSPSACGGVEFDTNLNDGVMSDGVYLSCVMKPLSITNAKSNRLDENRF